MKTFVFVCACCGKRSPEFRCDNIQEAKGEAQRAGWIVDITFDVQRLSTADPSVRALCDNPSCEYPEQSP